MVRAEHAETTRFYGLDVLRGVAALGVVLWHWDHFFWNGTGFGNYQPNQAPLAGALGIFYQRGSLGVDLFFGLSGFIFAWLYGQKIHDRQVGAKDFAILRFSRLYPLHFATLLFVAIAQQIRVDQGLIPFVYVLNDVWHFILNLFLVSGWNINWGLSFNGPVWSVSVEVFLYAVFFAMCRLVRPTWWIWLGLAIGGMFIEKFLNPFLGRGLGSFFLGGLMFLLYRRLMRRPTRRTIALAATFLIGAWTLTFSAFVLDFNEEAVGRWYIANFDHSQHAFLWLDHKIFSAWPLFVLFPGTILSLAIVETSIRPLVRPIAFVGDISYSSYLLHFPLQLLAVSAIDRLKIARMLVYEPLFLGIFFGVLVAFSLCSYHLFERPMQARIRGRVRTRLSTPSPSDIGQSEVP